MFFKNLRTIIVCLFVTCLGVVSGISPVKGQSSTDFLQDIKAVYTIKNDGSADVEYEFTTTNKVENNYLKTFIFQLPFEPKNLIVSNSPTPIRIKEIKPVSTRPNYSLEIEIINPVYGNNKRFVWKINFRIEKLVLPHGIQNAVVVPTFNNQSNISNFQITIALPKIFGEVRYIYGGGSLSQNDTTNTIVYNKASDIADPSLTILVGPDQEYFFETQNISRKTPIHLPLSNGSQDVVFTQFPERSITMQDAPSSLKTITLEKDENVKAFIKATQNFDMLYEQNFEEVTNPALAKTITEKTAATKDARYQSAYKIFQYMGKNYELSEYVTTIDTVTDVLTSKNKLNPAELNKIFREALTSIGIENRGAYGYVFPIQPFTRQEYKTEQHVWSEFWDGERWVVVDPTWYISSKGDDYFNKNAFHHLKFGDYTKFSDLLDFFQNAGAVKVTPVTNKSLLERTIEVDMKAEIVSDISKTYKLSFTNKSNQPINLFKIKTVVDLEEIKVNNPNETINKLLLPNTTLTTTISLDYDLLLKDKPGTLRVNLDYIDIKDKNKITTHEFTHAVVATSNISAYVSQIILGIVVLLLLVSVVSFLIYHKIRKPKVKPLGE